MTKEYEYAVIGGGPAGIVFHNHLVETRKVNKANIALFEKGEVLCSDLSTYGKFVRNYGVDNNTKWDFLVDGEYYDPEIASYFREKFVGNVIYSAIDRIVKLENQPKYQLIAQDNIYLSNKVILATGVRLKQIEAIAKPPVQTFNITETPSEDLKNIDFLNHELILVGSGDKALLKAIRLAKHIESNGIKTPHIPISIFVKDNLATHANPEFTQEAMSYIEKGIIQIVTKHWQIEKVNLNEYGLVEHVVSKEGQYTSKAPNGSYLGVFIGFEGKWPTLVNCSIENIICIGDLSLALAKRKINIPDALLDAEQKARNISI